MPKISVIVPVYKVESYLDRCVESILAQTFGDFELILVDDGSPDNCPALCDAWAQRDSRIKVIHKENGGLSDARNVGFAASEGQWITFIDSDDYAHPKMLQALYDGATKLGAKVSVCGFSKTRGEPLADPTELTATLRPAEDFYLQRNVNATVAWGKLYHRSVVLPYPKGKLHEDEFVTYRILFGCGNVAVIDAALYGYYQNPESIMQSRWSPRRIDAIEAFQEQMDYFRRRKLVKPYRLRVRGYVRLIAENIRQIDASKERTLGRQRRALIKKGRRCVRKHWKDRIFSLGGDRDFLGLFFPLWTKLYDPVKWLLKKLGFQNNGS